MTQHPDINMCSTQLREALLSDDDVLEAEVTTDSRTGGGVAHVYGPDGENLSAPLLLGRLRTVLGPDARPAMIRVYPESLVGVQLDLAPIGERLTPVPLVAPRNVLERRLIDTWRLLLNLDALGIDDDFYESGGHSLLVVEMLDRLRQDHAIAVPAEVFFLSPTVRQLAEAVATWSATGSVVQQ